jgi:hypothetical protein
MFAFVLFVKGISALQKNEFAIPVPNFVCWVLFRLYTTSYYLRFFSAWAVKLEAVIKLFFYISANKN